MQKKSFRFLALLLSILLLCGCAKPTGSLSSAISGQTTLQSTDPQSPEQTDGYVHYSDMAYVRVEMATLQASLDAVSELAKGTDTDKILDGVEEFYDLYNQFYTCYYLADIRYSGDLTDTYWEAEYDYCMSCEAEVDSMLDSLYRTLAASPARRSLEKEYFGTGFFDSYDGDSFYDDVVMALLEKESELESRYYAQQSTEYTIGTGTFYNACADGMAQTLVELIRVRQELAAHCGYASYPEFANDYYYYRDYTPQQTQEYLNAIQRELVPLYRKHWSGASSGKFCTDSEVMNYVRNTANAMGGKVQEAFTFMETYGLYDISYSKNKYNSSFEVYLEYYGEPFVFMNPQGTRYDCLTFAHEFGHFCNDFASQGSYVGIDVLEIFSQGMEYLSLSYNPDGKDLVRLKMADSLCTYVEQSCFASFEQQMYSLTGDDLSVEGLYELYDRTAKAFGFDAPGYDRREFVTIPHLYTNPMYIISYVVSNDAAMQLYELERSQPGSGLARFTEHLDTEEDYFLAFLESADLTSPFDPSRILQVRDLFTALL